MSGQTYPKAQTAQAVALFASVAFGVVGQLLMKWSALKSVEDVHRTKLFAGFLLAIGIYSLGVVCWMYALRRINLSIAYSVSGLNYAGILVGSYIWFGEHISVMHLLGVVLIFSGVIVVVLRGPKDARR